VLVVWNGISEGTFKLVELSPKLGEFLFRTGDLVVKCLEFDEFLADWAGS